MSDGGKGSAPRPLSVSHSDYAKRYDEIFRKPICELCQRQINDEFHIKYCNEKENCNYFFFPPVHSQPPEEHMGSPNGPIVFQIEDWTE